MADDTSRGAVYRESTRSLIVSFLVGIKVFIDRGGTFTDVIAFAPILPSGYRNVVVKLLSVDPQNYPDAPREGIRRIQVIRMGTTVATNALLERQGERVALFITTGFKDLLHIGNQARPRIFDLEIKMPDVLYERVVEVDERVTLVGYTSSPSGMDVKIPDNDPSYLRGITNEWVHILKKPEHERIIGKLAEKVGFSHITLSSTTSPMIKIVPRGLSSVADAYLTPCIGRYIQGFYSGFDAGIRDHDRVRVEFMRSDGGLAPVDRFSGLNSILSGPAGGVVGYAMTSFDPVSRTPVIGFDMGGTSTDVSRYAGSLEHVYETTTAGVTIQAPQLDINTVAAGGGSRLFFRNGMFVVGPESAGANPGPACYRKGGPLTITDANLLLGRLVPGFFPKIFGPTESEPLDVEATRRLFSVVAGEVNASLTDGKQPMSLDEVAFGFVKVANEAMCRPIRALTQARGFDTSKHILASFGGAGGQHACAIARSLGIKMIFIHKYSSILSAYGIALADIVHEVQEPRQETFDPKNLDGLRARITALTSSCKDALLAQNFPPSRIETQVYLNLRYQGTDTSIMTPQPTNGSHDFTSAFIARHRQEFGFTLPDRPIIVDDVRVRGVGRGDAPPDASAVHRELRELRRRRLGANGEKAAQVSSVYWDGVGRVDTPVYVLTELEKGDECAGPALIIDATATIAVEPGCVALVTAEHVVIECGMEKVGAGADRVGEDPIMLSVFGHRFMSIAERFLSDNDFKVANAPHIPVHLGSMQEAVRWQMGHLRGKLREGDVVMTNHPAAGGSHLPDITIITPVFNEGKIVGMQPGSMPPNSCELYQEGAATKSFLLVKDGKFDEEGVTEILYEIPGKYPGCSGSRCLKDNLSDLKAQVAANHRGITLVQGLIEEYSLEVVQAYMNHIQKNAEIAVRNLLINYYETRGKTLEAEDYMDDGSVIKLKIELHPDGSANFDFTGTGPELYGNINAPRSVTYSAIIYCLRCMVNLDMPLNQGALAPITIHIPNGCLLDPSENAAVVGGNVLTSQRLCDVILKCFEACSASQGCCNNFTFGSDAGKGGFGYYETIAGGSGAGPGWDGRSGVHTHMTNTRITDPEVLERRYPVLLRRYGLREGSGGKGEYLEFLETLHVSMLSERRVFRPYGLKGGEAGQRGLNLLIRKGANPVNFGGKNATVVHRGDVIRIETPGGGGFGQLASGGKRKRVVSNEADGARRIAGGSLAAMEETQRDF
ncbi:hypothetical protein HK101_011585 [Irineochytrium annulatum]|nr:hypothetical protein HK101_011585 [Irineochytrium annulatum]